MVELTEAEMRRIEARWKSDMDSKMDRVVRFIETYESYLMICMVREETRGKLRNAIIEKSLIATVWVIIAFMATASWHYIKKMLE